MTATMDQYGQSHRRYAILDGTGEMTMGLGLLFFAVFTWLSGPNGLTFWRWMLVMYAGTGVLWAIAHFGTRYIRRRLVYPRSGYLKMRKRPWKLALLALLSGMISAAWVVYFVPTRSWVLSPPLAMGMLMGLAGLIAALLHHAKKFVAYAAISFGIGILLEFIEPQAPLNAEIVWRLLPLRSVAIHYFLIMGIVWLIGGVLTLYLYTHHTPECNLEAE